MTRHAVKVILVEDEALFRELLDSSLRQRPEVELIATFADGESALLQAPVAAPDVAILDIDLGPGDTGVQVGLRLREVFPQIGIVLLSNYDEPGIFTMLPTEQLSGWSYLLKKSVANLDTIIRAIEGSAAGLMVIDPHVIRALRPRAGGVLKHITPRQREILSLIAQGYSNRAIADELVITEKSVENQISLIYQNLGLQSSEFGVHPRVKATLLFLADCD